MEGLPILQPLLSSLLWMGKSILVENVERCSIVRNASWHIWQPIVHSDVTSMGVGRSSRLKLTSFVTVLSLTV
jgi:hypothetical protein